MNKSIKKIKIGHILNFFIDLYRWFKLHIKAAIVISAAFIFMLLVFYTINIERLHFNTNRQHKITQSSITTNRIKQFNHVNAVLDDLKKKLDKDNLDKVLGWLCSGSILELPDMMLGIILR
jgi:hypothetical protein